MRRFAGVVCLLLGVLVAVPGAAAAVIIGPDDTVTTAEHHLSTKGSVVVTAADLIDFVGPTLHVTARSTEDKPVFIGVGHEIEVGNYLGTEGTYATITRVRLFPWEIEKQQVKSVSDPPPKPVDLNLWVAAAHDRGTVSLAWPITDGAWNVVFMHADASPGLSVDYTFGVEVEWAFLTCLGVSVFGLLLLVLGVLLVRRRRRPAASSPVPPEFERVA